MKQTAVEWLLEQIFNHNNLVKGDGWFYVKPNIIEQAKEMEKKQLGEVWDEAIDEDSIYTTFEQYYNETFKSE